MIRTTNIGRKKNPQNPAYELQYVAAGVTDDVELLISKAASRENYYDFEVFCDVWKEMGFSLIYMGRETLKELRAFTHEVFSIVLNIIVADSSYKNKILAFYVLYGLYFKQPTDLKFKVRVTPPIWDLIMNMFEFGKRKKLDCFCRCVLEMIDASAFAIVHCSELMGPSMVHRKHWQKKPDTPFNEDWLAISRTFHEQGSLQRMIGVNKAYESKLEAYKKKKSLPDVNRTKVNEEFADILSLFNKVTTSTSLESIKEVDIELANSAPIQVEAPKEPIGIRRKELKEKQMNKSSMSKSKKRCKNLLSGKGEKELKKSGSSSDEELSESERTPQRKLRSQNRHLASLGIYVEGEQCDQSLEDDEYNKEMLDKELFIEDDDEEYVLPTPTRKRRSKGRGRRSKDEKEKKSPKRKKKPEKEKKKKSPKRQKKERVQKKSKTNPKLPCKKEKKEEEEMEVEESCDVMWDIKVDHEFLDEVLKGPKLKQHTHIDSDEDMEA